MPGPHGIHPDIAGEPLKLLSSTNFTDASFAAIAPTTTKPTGAGVFTIGPRGVVNCCFFGVGSDTNTFGVRFFRWMKLGSLYVPRFLGGLTATLSSSITGVASNTDTPNGDSDLFADTLTLEQAQFQSIHIEDGIADTYAAWAEVLCLGTVDGDPNALVQVIFDMTGATSGNMLYYLSN